MLQVENIHTYYGESYIIQGVSLDLKKGEISTLLGRNGAGKTTTLRSITGLTPPRLGRIMFQGKDITRLKTFEIVRLGLVMVPEERRIFTRLTILENLNIAVQRGRQGYWNLRTIYELFPVLSDRRHHRGHQLSGGEQQMLAIARALMGNPTLLMLDEPSEGLAPLVVKLIGETIITISKEGITILLVEQNIEMSLRVSHRHNIIDQGKIIYVGSREDFIQNRGMVNQYLTF